MMFGMKQLTLLPGFQPTGTLFMTIRLHKYYFAI